MLTLCKSSGYFLCHHVQHSKILPLLVQCNYVFCLDGRANGNYFPCRINFCFFIAQTHWFTVRYELNPQIQCSPVRTVAAHLCCTVGAVPVHFCCSWSGKLLFFLAFFKYFFVSNVHVCYFFHMQS
jgi:hypothetical protein